MARKPANHGNGPGPVAFPEPPGSSRAAMFPASASASDPAYHVELGNTYLEMGSLADAAESFRRALSLDPSLPEAHFNLGVVLADQEDAVSAVASYRRAIEHAPQFFEAHFNLGDMLNQLGRLDEAVDSYRNAGALDPSAVDVQNNLGTVLIELGSFDEAIDALRRAVFLAPGDVAAHTNLGTALKHAGRFEEAVESQRHATALAPGSADAHFNLGMALAQSGDHESAVDSYKKALASDATLARAGAKLCASLMATGRYEEALGACDEFLSRVPAERSILAIKAFVLQDMGRATEAGDLADYETLIHPIEVAVPDEFESLDAFNAALVAHVLDHPSLVVSPTSHATVNGRHTGNLLVEPKGPFAAFEKILWQAVEDYTRQRLPDDNHPYLSAWPTLDRVVAWSVVMDRDGHQVPHIHPSGWLSGVYYPELPGVISDSDPAREGWIEFGLPPDDIPVRETPTLKLFQPKEGRLFLFPSYFYHRTVPYQTQERRVSIAFDFLAAD
ncbi:MAG: tetratricopeptide repeat protein [Alphaproteobacteria bacterium]|nr:tetratricopeptide repeat protein [Alphaproteobacteria bacterium]